MKNGSYRINVKENGRSDAKAQLSSSAIAKKYTVKTGSGKRPDDLKKTVAKQARRLYSPVEADRIKRDYGMMTAEPRNMRKARRSMILKPAPKDPTIPKGKFGENVNKIVLEVKEFLSHIDYSLLVIVAVLSCIGILAVHSATITKGSARFDFMQIAMTVIGFCLMLGLTYIDYDVFTKHYKIILILNVIMLAFTAVFGTGADGGGDTNHNWVRIGSFGIQPAEIGKILYIITFAAHLDAVKHRINHIKTLFGLLLHAGLIIGLVLLERDLGQATVYIAITLVMLFAAKLSVWYFAGAGIIGLAAAPIIFSNLKGYQKERILVGFNPELDPVDKGYQAIQSKTAIGSGGVTGAGYRKGYLTQSVPSLLPAKQTDMIFAVIAEEFGFVGAAVVILLLAALVIKIFMNSITADRMSGALICAGVAGMLTYQIIENIGMCLGMLPVIGITLPFLSYGGSSILGNYLAIGMVLSVYAKNDRFYFSKGKI
ncbi:MAG: rod shape-determining protein RodA [Clostridia bacterium]|nr:rod shape-determining protein RodA [Clostridia bacterium]